MNPGKAITSGAIRPWRALNWPNRISLLRLLLVAPFIVLILNQNHPEWRGARYAALVVFFLMAVSDFLDGLLARRLNARTRLGAILDPLADKILIVCSVLLLAMPDSAVHGFQVPNWVVVAVVGKDLWVVLGFMVVYLHTENVRIRPTYAGKISTFGQLVMVISVLIGPELNALAASAAVGPVGTYLATAMEYIVAGLSVLAVISYTRMGLSYIVESDRPLDENNGRKGTAAK